MEELNKINNYIIVTQQEYRKVDMEWKEQNERIRLEEEHARMM